MAPATSHNDDKIVLVTGINGYIAAALGLTLLQHGYTVRGTSRNPEHETVLRSGPYKVFPESQFQYVHVPDIMAPGAFDAAVVGCTAILPLASPVGEADAKGLDGFMRPAIMSATSVLHSAHNHAGPQLECVVYMSSVAGVFDFGKCMAHPTYAFSENDWNEFSERMARQVGDENAPRYLLYPASKVAAEKAVWKFRDERKVSPVQPLFLSSASSAWSGCCVLPFLIEVFSCLSQKQGYCCGTTSPKPSFPRLQPIQPAQRHGRAKVACSLSWLSRFNPL